MSATLRDFAFERSCIEASNDDRAILDWMREYQEDRGRAKASGDDDTVQELDDLLEFAEDRVVAIKEARNAPPAPIAAPVRAEPRAGPRGEAHRGATEPVVVQRMAVPSIREHDRPPERQQRRQRDDATEIAAAKQIAAERAAAEEAEAEAKRRDDEELRQLRQRAQNAEARVRAAQAETARLKAVQQQAAVAQERERRQREKERAARDARAQEQAAAGAEAAARAAAQVVIEVAAMPAPVISMPQDPRQASVATESGPATAPVELTTIARLFQERLAEPALTPTAAAIAAPNLSGTVTQPPRKSAAKASVVPPKAPAADPIDDLPPLTGADLASYRTWLGASQRALAAKLAVEQSVICKGEGKPTTVLPPQLRKALHQAMGEPRPDFGGAS